MTNTDKATARPWTQSAWYVLDPKASENDIASIIVDCDSHGCVDTKTATANAALIVLAVNERDSLLARVKELEEALKEASLQIKYLHGRVQETGSGNQVLAKIDAAISTIKDS